MFGRRFPKTRRGVSLLELIAVVTLLGIMATVSVASFRRGTLANANAKADATRINGDLRLARTRAIASGDNHLLSFGGGAGAYNYQVLRRNQDGTTTIIQDTFTFHKDVTVTVTPSNPEFNFEGDATASCTITLRTADKTYQVLVNQVTGTSRIVIAP